VDRFHNFLGLILQNSYIFRIHGTHLCKGTRV
jgi:hypothetical protein